MSSKNTQTTAVASVFVATIFTVVAHVGPSHTAQTNIPEHNYKADETAEGVTIYANHHNSVECHTGGTLDAYPGDDLENVKYWMYEYTGNESLDDQGRPINFDGEFYLSPAALSYELERGNDYSAINTLRTMREYKRYYVMSDTNLNFRCGDGFSLDAPSVCGDGEIEGEEECDDRNELSGDGCSDECVEELGYDCNNEPSNCSILIPTLPGDDDDGGSDSVGNLYIHQHPTPYRSRHLLGGEEEEPLLRLDLRATGESVDISHLQITADGEGSSYLEWIDLYVNHDQQPFARATGTTCGDALVPQYGTTYCFSDMELIVSDREDTDLTFVPRIQGDDEAESGGELTLVLDASTRTGSNAAEYAVKATGLTTNRSLRPNDGQSPADGEFFIGTDNPDQRNSHIPGGDNVIVMAKIDEIASATSPNESTTMPTDIYPFAAFLFRTAPHNNDHEGVNDVVIDTLIFNVEATNVDLEASTFALYNDSDASNTHPCDVYSDGSRITDGNVTGFLIVVCADLNGTTFTEIDDGTEIILALQADIVTPNNRAGSGLPSYLQATLTNFSNKSLTTLGISENHSHIRWFDQEPSKTTPESTHLWVEHPEERIEGFRYEG